MKYIFLDIDDTILFSGQTHNLSVKRIAQFVDWAKNHRNEKIKIVCASNRLLRTDLHSINNLFPVAYLVNVRDLFDDAICFDGCLTKKEAIQKYIADKNISPQDCVLVDDTPIKNFLYQIKNITPSTDTRLIQRFGL